MKRIFKFILFCCKDNEKLNKDIQKEDIAEKADQENSRDNLNALSFEEPDKENTPDIEGRRRTEKQLLKVRKNRPSIILSMDGTEHKIVLIKGQTTI